MRLYNPFRIARFYASDFPCFFRYFCRARRP